MSNSSAPSTFLALPWHRATPMAPGTAVPVELMVNGIFATPQCAAATYVKRLPGQNVISYEPASDTTIDGQCHYYYSVYRTPTLFASTPGVGPSIPGGVVAVNYTRAADRYTLTVSGCSNPDGTHTRRRCLGELWGKAQPSA
jgi:hypothetical protein